jgi:hypothetical protein
MRNSLFKTAYAVGLLALAKLSIGQTTTINYLTSGLSTSSCNVFNPSATINGVQHTARAGGVTFNTSFGIGLATTPQSSPPGGTAYVINYNFVPGNNYTISITALGNPALFLKTSVVPNFNQFPTNGTSGCSPDQNISSYQTVGVGQLSTQTSTTSTTYNVQQFSVPGSSVYPYLIIWASGGQASLSLDNLSISQVVITQTAISSFTLSPSTLPISCGITSTQTNFTITNVNNTPNVTNHTWNLGSASNGWLYNGNPAPQTISTGTTNTISLTPVCGATPSNVSATVTAGGNSYQTNTATVSVSNPTLSIGGNSSFCTGTSNYSISNLPCNASVSWSASPSGIVSLSCTSCSSTTLAKLADGVVTLTATITKTNACSSGTEVKDLTVTVGAPKIIYAPSGQEAFNLTGQRFNYGANGPGNSFSVCPSEYLTFTPYFPSGYNPPTITAHQWTISGSYSSVGFLTQDYLSVTSASTHPNAFNFTYQYQNSCGWSPVYYGSAGTMNCDNGEEPFRVSPTKTPKEKIIKQDGLVSVFPNPVNDVLYISINSKDFGRVTVKLYNALGKEVKKVLVISPLTSINLSALTKGIYFVQILDGQKITTHKVIKN